MAYWLHVNLTGVQLILGLSPYVVGSPGTQYMEYAKWEIKIDITTTTS